MGDFYKTFFFLVIYLLVTGVTTLFLPSGKKLTVAKHCLLTQH